MSSILRLFSAVPAVTQSVQSVNKNNQSKILTDKIKHCLEKANGNLGSLRGCIQKSMKESLENSRGNYWGYYEGQVPPFEVEVEADEVTAKKVRMKFKIPEGSSLETSPNPVARPPPQSSSD